MLEGANIKLASVASDVLGKSGRAMAHALVSGVIDPKTLAGMAKGRLQDKKDQLEQALYGLVDAHQCKLLSVQLRHIDFLDREIDQLSEEVAARMRPFEEALGLLETVPGVGRRTAEMILSEIGPDMAGFPSAAHLASWAGMCPGNNESAGKRLIGRTRKGSLWLRETLVEAGRAAGRSKHTYLSALYHRVAARRGSNRAAVAVGHAILVCIYHMLKNHVPYQDLGANYFDERNRAKAARKAVERLQKLGYKVSIEPSAA